MSLKNLSLCLALLVFFTLLPMVLSAQENMGMSNSQMSVTGCLKQGTDTGGYYIVGQDGKTYELSGKNLGEHVGHTVTVSGKAMKMSESKEKKMEKDEKAEAGSGQPAGDLKVSSLKMVSTSCQ